MFREILYRLNEKLDRTCFTSSACVVIPHGDKRLIPFAPFFPPRRANLSANSSFCRWPRRNSSDRGARGYIKARFSPFDRDSHDPDTFHSLAFCIVI